MLDSTIILLFPGLFALALGIVIYAAGGPEGGKPYFMGGKTPLDFKTILFFAYIAAILAHFILA